MIVFVETPPNLATVWPVRLLLVTSLAGLAAFVDTNSNLIGPKLASICVFTHLLSLGLVKLPVRQPLSLQNIGPGVVRPPSQGIWRGVHEFDWL